MLPGAKAASSLEALRASSSPPEHTRSLRQGAPALYPVALKHAKQSTNPAAYEPTDQSSNQPNALTQQLLHQPSTQPTKLPITAPTKPRPCNYIGRGRGRCNVAHTAPPPLPKVFGKALPGGPLLETLFHAQSTPQKRISALVSCACKA